MKERGRKNIVIVVRDDKKNNVWSHKNFIISWHKVGVMKSFFFGGGAEKWAWSPATSDKFGSAPYFLPFFWLPPLGGVTGRLTFIPPYGNFFLSAGWKKKKKNWQIESENLVCATKHQINWKLLRGMRIITILQTVPIAIIKKSSLAILQFNYL